MPKKKLSSVVSDAHCCGRHRQVSDGPGRCVECLREAVIGAKGAIVYLQDTLEHGLETGPESSVGHWGRFCERWLGSGTVLAAKTDGIGGTPDPEDAVRKIAALAAGAGGACPCNCHDPAVCGVSEPFDHHDCTECWGALIGEIIARG